MSLSQKLYRCVESSIEDFISKISMTYEIDSQELKTIWNDVLIESDSQNFQSKQTYSDPVVSESISRSSTQNEKKAKSVGGSKSKGETLSVDILNESSTMCTDEKPKILSTEDLIEYSAEKLKELITLETLLEYKADTLRSVCKKKGLKSSGKKEQLAMALLSPSADGKKVQENGGKSAITSNKVEGSSKSSISNKLPSSIKSAFAGSKPTPISSSVASKFRDCIVISKNDFGNYEHPETKLISDGQKMIGKQDPSGKILPLSKEDIEVCHRLNFDYTLPKNLDDGTEMVMIEGEDEDDEEEDIEEEAEIEDDEDYEIEDD